MAGVNALRHWWGRRPVTRRRPDWALVLVAVTVLVLLAVLLGR